MWRRKPASGAAETNGLLPVAAGDQDAWIAQACVVDDFACEAVFALAPSVYVGPDNGISAADWNAARVQLPPVALFRQIATCVTTAELLGHEDKLVAHYRGVVEIARMHGKAESLRSFPYFRIKPAIIAAGHFLTEFPWTDTLHETRTILEVLAAAGGAPGLVHADTDQGWELIIVATGAATCLIEWDAEGPPPTGRGFAFDPSRLAQQAAAALARLHVIHTRLVEAMGHDHWT